MPEIGGHTFKITQFSDEIDCHDGRRPHKGSARDRTGWTVEFSTNVDDSNRKTGALKGPTQTTDFTWEIEERKEGTETWSEIKTDPPIFGGCKRWKIDSFRRVPPSSPLPNTLEIVCEREIESSCTETIRITMVVQ